MQHLFTPKKHVYLFGPSEPALVIHPGDTIVTITSDAGSHDLNGNPLPPEMRQTSPYGTLKESNPLVGPFCVEGAEEGDTMVVRIERILLNRRTAYSRIIPNFGCFTGEARAKRMYLNDPLPERFFDWKLDLEHNIGSLELKASKLKRIEIPLNPFLGSIGVAPRYGRIETAVTPGEYGGNMDCVETREGTTIYLPVFAKGGFLAFGDVHAAQGDGEICGVALETTAEVTITIDLMKAKTIDWPRMEDAEYLMVAGSARPLMDAVRIAHYELIQWLLADYGFDKWEAVQVLSQVGTMRVGNVVDPNYTVVAKFPKKYLPG